MKRICKLLKFMKDIFCLINSIVLNDYEYVEVDLKIIFILLRILLNSHLYVPTKLYQ